MLEEGDAPNDFGLATFTKSKTQFDGVTHEMQVSYLNLKTNQGVEIPIMTTGVEDQNLDFTVMLWFKISPEYRQANAGESGPSQIMYLFSFEDSVACFFTDTLTLMCDSWDRQKLTISADHIMPGIWYHLTLSCQAEGDSYLLI